MIKAFTLLALVSFGFIAPQANVHQKTTIQGIVKGSDGKPVSNAYLYTVKGEEEALSNDKGEFKFDTWQKLPVTLTVDHSEFKKEAIKVTAPTRLEIILKKK